MKRFKTPASRLFANYIYRYWHTLINSHNKNLLHSVLLKILLSLSRVYERIVKIARKTTKRKNLKTKVISVGNITLGGTGKTPLVEYIGRWLRKEGIRSAILSRGYGGKIRQEYCLQGKTNLSFSLVGDEPLMLSRKNPDIPVVIGRNRYSAGKMVEDRLNIDTFILDDGFQHWSLAKDLEIVVLDSLYPFGNGHLIPRGNLRVPVDFLRYADIVVVTRTEEPRESLYDLKEKLYRINPMLLIAEAVYQPQGLRYLGSDKTLSLDELVEKPVGIFCGIGSPVSFRSTVERLNARVSCEFFFMDHYPFQGEDITSAVRCCKKNNVQWLITTEKDEVRLPEIKEPEIPILVLEISLRLFEGEEEIKDKIKETLKKNG